MSSLIRHVYGDDCSVLIEQFGLIPTFNRALQKFTEAYTATLTVESTDTAEEKKPVTRDVVVTKVQVEAEPAPVLNLTPPKPASDNRVANDPRERRRLAKLAAEQAKQARVEEAPAVVPAVEEPVVASTEVTPTIETEAVVDVSIDEKVEAKATVPVENTVTEATTPVVAKTETKKEEKASTANPKIESSNSEELKDDAELSDEDKPVRPRRPRGRPPKKVTPPTEE